MTRYGKGVIILGCTGAAFAVSHYKTLQQDPVYTKLVKQVKKHKPKYFHD